MSLFLPSLVTHASRHEDLEQRAASWHKEHLQTPSVADSISFHVKAWALRLHSFFSPAPDVEGIDPALQERNYIRLMLLRAASLGFGFMHNADRRKLLLSSSISFYQDDAGDNRLELKIDEEVQPLVEEVNRSLFMFTVDSCSGHVIENPINPDQCVVKDHGFVSLGVEYPDYLRERVDALTRQLSSLVYRYATQYDDQGYYLRIHKEKHRIFLGIGWRIDSLDERRAYANLKALVKASPLDADERPMLEERLFQLSLEMKRKMEANHFAQFMKDAAQIIRSERMNYLG